MATYRLFSYRLVNPLPEEIVDDENFYFPWESVSQTPTILTEPKTVTITEVFQRGDDTVEETIEHTIEAGEIDPAWYDYAECEHTKEVGVLQGPDETEIHMEFEDFVDVDEEGAEFYNQREVEKVVSKATYHRRYVLCCEHCTSYSLPDRYEARYENVAEMDDQTLRNLYEVSGIINIEQLRLGDDSQLNTLGLRNINWDTTVPYVTANVARPPAGTAVSDTDTDGTNTEGIAEE